MDWLHNPLADMGSLTYLLAYALCTALAIVAIRLQIAASDPTRGLPPPPVATDRDPAEVAYLRGGGNELLRFTVFDLLRRGLLKVSDVSVAAGAKKKSPETIEATDLGRGAAPDAAHSIEAATIGFYDTPRGVADLFKSELPALAETFGAKSYRPNLEREGMYVAAGVRETARRTAAYSAIVLLAVAAYRVIEAQAKGHHNLAFAVIEAFAATVLVFVFSRTGRLSARGTAFLGRLRTALLPMRSSALLTGAAALPIFVAATGVGALAGTDYAVVNRMFGRSTSSAGSSCGSCSSSSSSDSSSSSCGGGSCGGGCGG